jgi:hypothetical protein
MSDWFGWTSTALQSHARKVLARARNLVGKLNPYLRAPKPFPPLGNPRVLVVGVYMARKANSARHLVDAFQRSNGCRVEQHWIGLGGEHADETVRRVTARVIFDNLPKFSIINSFLSTLDVSQFDYLIVVDDDIRVRTGFLDSFIGFQQHFNLAVAQPARTFNSFNDHKIVRRRFGSLARLTWFVEIGPLFSLRRDTFALLLPFDPDSPMGYGYDLVWPTLIRKAEKRMGIVDCCPIDHSLRRRSSNYSFAKQLEAMKQFLAAREHQPYADAMMTVEWLR